MEKNLPFEQQIPHSSTEREATHSSRLQKTMRSILTPILLGGAVTALAVPLSVEGKDPVKQERKEEDLLLAKLKQEIPALIADLDSDAFPVRERAQRRLEQISVEWVKVKQKTFPLVALLQRKDGYSFEQQRRLERVLAAHEHEELQLLWRPTMVNIPPQWQGKDRPMLTDVFRELSSQTGYRLVNSRILTQEELQRKKIAFPAGGSQTFWGVGKVVHDRIGNLSWYARSDDAIDYHYSNATFQCACPSGAAVALVESFKGKEAWFSIALEPKLILGGITALRGEVVAENGKTMEVRCESYDRAQSEISLYLPSIPGAEKATLRMTVTIDAYEPAVVPIEDLRKEQEVPTEHDAFTYVGCEGGLQSGKEKLWMVRSRAKGDMDWGAVKRMQGMIRCQASDACGESLPWRGEGMTDDGWLRTFTGEPAHVRFIVPQRRTVKTMTFEFPDVPLPGGQ